MKRCWIILLCSFLVHCGSSEVGNPANPGNLATMEITDASTLYIAPGSAALSKRSSIWSQISNEPAADALFKIKEDGSVQEVIYRDEDGIEITIAEEPTAIINVSSDYVIVLFPNAVYLVRKADGAVFVVSDCHDGCEGLISPSPAGVFINSPLVPTDGDGNLYFSSTRVFSTGERGIVRVNVGDPEQLTWEFVSPKTDNIASFAVASNGTIAYTESFTTRRILKTNGSVENIPTLYEDFFPGLDGRFTFVDGNTCQIDLDKMAVDTDFLVTYADYGIIPDPYGLCPGFGGSNSYLLSLQDRIYVVSTQLSSFYSVFEVENPTQSPRAVTLSESFNSVLIADASDNFYYISGTNTLDQPVLIKVDPTTDEVTFLTTPNELEIVDMDVSPDDIVSFVALRFSDGARVVGEIDADGHIDYREEDLGGDVVSLERIR